MNKKNKEKKDNENEEKKTDKKSDILEQTKKHKEEETKAKKIKNQDKNIDSKKKDSDIMEIKKIKEGGNKNIENVFNNIKKEDQQESEDLPEEIKKKIEKKKLERNKKPFKKKRKKTEKKYVTTGKAYIQATYNNTIVTFTDLSGNVISCASAGVAGFKGPKKSTPYAAQIVTKIAAMKAKQEYNLQQVSVFVKGIGNGRESAVRSLNANGLIVTSIKDVTPMPHNGCRRKKARRV